MRDARFVHPAFSLFAGGVSVFGAGIVDVVDDTIYGWAGDYDLGVIGRLNQLAVEENPYLEYHRLNHPFL